MTPLSGLAVSDLADRFRTLETTQLPQQPNQYYADNHQRPTAGARRRDRGHHRPQPAEQRGANRIVADYKFSGEGVEWNRRMQLDLVDGDKTLVRRDEGEGAAAGPMRYTRCT